MLTTAALPPLPPRSRPGGPLASAWAWAGGIRHYAQVLAERPALAFWKSTAKTFCRRRAALEVLQRGGRCTRSACTGWACRWGSAVGLDDWHLAQLARLVERVDPVRVSDHASFARGRGRASLPPQPHRPPRPAWCMPPTCCPSPGRTRRWP